MNKMVEEDLVRFRAWTAQSLPAGAVIVGHPLVNEVSCVAYARHPDGRRWSLVHDLETNEHWWMEDLR